MSRLDCRVEEYLSIRRALGFKLDAAARLLPDFVAHLEAAGSQTVNVELAVAWATRPPGALPTAGWANRMTVVRGFAHWLHPLDPRTEVPPVGVLPRGKHRATPYLYSDAEIDALMAAARSLPSPLRAATFETLIGLLAVTGMRVGEAIHLDRSDIDWTEGAITVWAAKFNKSRQLALQPSTMDALAAYDRCRRRCCPRPGSPSLFVSRNGTRLIYTNVHQVFGRLRRAAGLTARSGSCRPRLHDLRHSFAVRTLLDWYRDGGDIAARLPWLSTYLGHACPVSTYWYLSAAPELLALAAGRLEAASEEVRP